ncbi:hypothetical protein GA0111570_10658 [Raineyella antarctica]|uniref:VOC domain-containing protein n=1 Tax=Raineyella antarctica TaxID=1577474 RepID=A0A1G6H4A5_9ACTN|nr:VOC family protein [Raineyella antarctica]SDB88256.1 hypothetical protein GA0111570_10658 [Raineyella antarctica]
MSENATPQGRPIWIDLTTTDADKARAFYSALFGWTYEDQGPDFGNYNMIKSGDAYIGGLMGRVPEMPAGPDAWTVYLQTPDAQATCDKAVANGGAVIVPPMPVGTSGTMGLVADPGHGATGFWQPSDFVGIEAFMVAGAPCWFELFTPAYDASLDFYREVFGWTVEPMADTDEFRYSTNGPESTATAGIGQATWLGEGQPAYWRTYLGATDVDETAKKILGLGGSVVSPVQDSPYGRFGEFMDDQGARFVVVTAPDA